MSDLPVVVIKGCLLFYCCFYIEVYSRKITFFLIYFCRSDNDPVTRKPLSCKDLTLDKNMKKSVVEYRTSQIEETDP